MVFPNQIKICWGTILLGAALVGCSPASREPAPRPPAQEDALADGAGNAALDKPHRPVWPNPDTTAYRRCEQAKGHWGHYACGAVAGRVTGARGQPLDSASVYFRVADTTYASGMYNAAPPWTDTAGIFRLQILRVTPRRAGLTGPDTVNMYVVASVRGRHYRHLGEMFHASDSVLVPIRFVPVGEDIPVMRVDLTVEAVPQ